MGTKLGADWNNMLKQGKEVKHDGFVGEVTFELNLER